MLFVGAPPVLLWRQRLEGAARHFYFFTPLSAQKLA